MGGGKLLVHWYQVNEQGQPVNAQGTVVESPASPIRSSLRNTTRERFDRSAL